MRAPYRGSNGRAGRLRSSYFKNRKEPITVSQAEFVFF